VFSLRLLGTPSVEGEQGPITGRPVQRHRLALLALLATAPSQALSRDKLISYLWAESDTARARHLLSVSVHVLRRALGEKALLTEGDDLRLNTDVIQPDVVEFELALARDDPKQAVGLYVGPFLDGFYLGGAPEFEQWVDDERARRAQRYEQALEELGQAAEDGGDFVAAARWWRQLAKEQPYSARIAVRVIKGLAASGDRGEAVLYARQYEALLAEELEIPPDADVTELVERLQTEPTTKSTLLEPMEPRVEPHAAAREETFDRIAKSIPSATAIGGVPRFRQWSTAAVSMALLLTLGSHSGSDPGIIQERVLVVAFENQTGDASLDPIGRMASDWIVQSLSKTGLIHVVSPMTALRAAQYLGEPDTLSAQQLLGALALETEADIVVSGSYYRRGDEVTFLAEISDPASGEVLRTVEGVSAPTEAPLDGVEVLRQRVGGALATVVDRRLAAWAHGASQPPNLTAYSRFADGMDNFLRMKFGDAAADFEHAAALDSTFTTPLLWVLFADQWGDVGGAQTDSIVRLLEQAGDRLAPWDRAMLEYLVSRRGNDHVGAYHAMRRVVEIAPNSEWRFMLGSAALDINRPQETVDQLSQIDPTQGWVGEWHPYWRVLTAAHHFLGNYGEQLAAARRAAQLWPENHVIVWEEAAALVALGRVEDAFRVIEEVPTSSMEKLNPATAYAALGKTLRVHGYPVAARRAFDRGFALYEERPSLKDEYDWVYAVFLYEAGRWDEAQAAFEKLEPGQKAVEKYGFDLWIEGYLSVLAARRGDRNEVLRYTRRFEALEKGYGFGRRWRARIAAILGDRDEAVRLLREGFKGGRPWAEALQEFHMDIDYESSSGPRARNLGLRTAGPGCASPC
jgi:DNA-binding SARP family transcriptional activator